MENKKIKVGVVGCGQIAQIVHLPYLQELTQFEISALCDLSQTVVDQLGEKYHIKHRYLDFKELVKQDDLDVVLVINKNHAEPTIAALDAGKHVLVEKPIAFNLKQADEMIAVAKKNNVKLMVAYMKRYDPAYELMQKLVADIEHVHMIRVHDFAGTYKINLEIYDIVSATDLKKEELEKTIIKNQTDILTDIGTDRIDLLEAYDIMIHLCIHDINALHGLYGLPEKIVSCQLFDRTIVTGLLEYKNGVRCVWETGNLVSLIDWDEHIKVYGSNKRIEIKFPFPYLKNAASVLNIDENEGSSASRKHIYTSYDEAFKREWQHFYDCIVNDTKPRTNGEEARRDLEFAVELMSKAKKGDQ